MSIGLTDYAQVAALNATQNGTRAGAVSSVIYRPTFVPPVDPCYPQRTGYCNTVVEGSSAVLEHIYDIDAERQCGPEVYAVSGDTLVNCEYRGWIIATCADVSVLDCSTTTSTTQTPPATVAPPLDVPPCVNASTGVTELYGNSSVTCYIGAGSLQSNTSFDFQFIANTTFNATVVLAVSVLEARGGRRAHDTLDGIIYNDDADVIRGPFTLHSTTGATAKYSFEYTSVNGTVPGLELRTAWADLDAVDIIRVSQAVYAIEPACTPDYSHTQAATHTVCPDDDYMFGNFYFSGPRNREFVSKDAVSAFTDHVFEAAESLIAEFNGNARGFYQRGKLKIPNDAIVGFTECQTDDGPYIFSDSYDMYIRLGTIPELKSGDFISASRCVSYVSDPCPPDQILQWCGYLDSGIFDVLAALCSRFISGDGLIMQITLISGSAVFDRTVVSIDNSCADADCHASDGTVQTLESRLLSSPGTYIFHSPGAEFGTGLSAPSATSNAPSYFAQPDLTRFGHYGVSVREVADAAGVRFNWSLPTYVDSLGRSCQIIGHDFYAFDGADFTNAPAKSDPGCFSSNEMSFGDSGLSVCYTARVTDNSATGNCVDVGGTVCANPRVADAPSVAAIFQAVYDDIAGETPVNPTSYTFIGRTLPHQAQAVYTYNVPSP